MRKEDEVSERWDIFVLQVEDGIRDLVRSRGLGDVYKRQTMRWSPGGRTKIRPAYLLGVGALFFLRFSSDFFWPHQRRLRHRSTCLLFPSDDAADLTRLDRRVLLILVCPPVYPNLVSTHI
mgnify:CR=1 FL=1